MLQRFVSLGLLSLVLMTSSKELHAQRAGSNSLHNTKFWQGKPTIEAIKAEIDKGNSPTEANVRMMDATTMAILGGAPLEAISYLMSLEGNPVTKQTHHYRTYLHWAASSGRLELVELLLSLGADIHALDEHGNTPLTYAIGNGMRSLELVKLFEQKGYNLKLTNKQGASLLLQVIGTDTDLTLTDYLISRGLQLNATDVSGANAFDYTARHGQIELMRKVLARGIKPTNKALLMAAQGARRTATPLEVYRYLIEELKLSPLVTAPDGSNLLHAIATKPKQIEIAQYLVSKGIKPQQANQEGNTPLLLASGSNNLDIVNYFLSQGGSLETRNLVGESALWMAIQYGSLDMVKLLLSRGASPLVTNTAGYNLVYVLATNYREPMPSLNGGGTRDEFADKLALLDAAGLDVRAPQPDGSTLYHYAASRGSLSMLEVVAGMGLDINVVNSEGLTALHKAALTAKDDKVLLKLIALGANKTIKTDLDESAYDLARENKYLQDNGVDITFLQ